MRITYRNKFIKKYWLSRWNNLELDEAMENNEVYPLKFANEIIKNDRASKILEAGCGAGRLLRYYHSLGIDIVGIDYIDEVIKKLKQKDETLKVQVEDITNLSFQIETFKYVLAFGLYHNLPIEDNSLTKALRETYRVLKPGGYLCASFRADNIQTRINDFFKNIKVKNDKDLYFHKINFKKKEIIKLIQSANLGLISIKPIQNMPLLYKLRVFRSRKHKNFNESLGRKEGYKLSKFGNFIQNFLMRFFPDFFCNMYLVVAYKKNE